ncbi:helix-turn-helix domain-containing protein [Actinocorallia populi]|uniref:helix-turn-helix domain-containing protein n=1 Tax=Actinocorallia populi TaxID=2079200 RepID=UPI000D0890AD|nr:helix-turn-helix transcriptional regulator [Actinocorallia populi]
MGARAGDHSGSPALQTGAGPVVARIRLGLALRRHREGRNISRPAAAVAISAPAATLSGLELGQVPARLRDVIALCELYGIDDLAERAALLSLAREASVPGWWSAFADVVPDWFGPFLGLEHSAEGIRSYDPQFVPGLLQHRDYASAVIGLGGHRCHPDELEHRLALRMARQRRLHDSDDPPKVWAIIDETVLYRRVGDRMAMFRQLRHLEQLCDLPELTIQVLPFSAGGHITGGRPIILLSPQGGSRPDVVYLEQLTTALYLDDPRDVEYYRLVLHSLATMAHPPAETPRILWEAISKL